MKVEVKEHEKKNWGKGKIEAIHATILNELISKIGMKFENEDETYDFYNAYVYKVGFGIRKSKGHKDNKGKMICKTFCCSCEGCCEKDK